MTVLRRQTLRRRAHTRHTERYWRERDIAPDEYTCPMCGHDAQGLDREFHVHHIDGDWLNGHPLNLVAIYHSCHVRVHRLRNQQDALAEWKQEFADLASEDDESLNKPHVAGSESILGGEHA